MITSAKKKRHVHRDSWPMPNWQDFVCKEKDLVGEMPKSRNRLWISLEMIRAQKLDGLNDLYIPEMTGFLPLMNSAPAIAMWHLDQSQCTTHWYHPLGILRPAGFPKLIVEIHIDPKRNSQCVTFPLFEGIGQFCVYVSLCQFADLYGLYHPCLKILFQTCRKWMKIVYCISCQMGVSPKNSHGLYDKLLLISRTIWMSF